MSRAVAQARAGRGRADLPAGRYPVVLGAEAVGELLGFLPDVGFTGTLAAAGIGITAQAGQPLAAPLVNVADDGGADVGLPIGFDIEGVTKRRVDFFRHGLVGEAVTDLATAAALGRPSTGHAHIAREQVPEPTAPNIVMPAGTAAPRTSSSPSWSMASTCSDSGTRGWWTGSRARSPGSPGTPAS